MDYLTGRVIGNYRILDKLGEGGMGTVYHGLDTMVEREVALKSLRPEIAAQPGVLDRFRREAVVLAHLNHPAIAQLYTFFKDGDQFFMVMEYVAGSTLEQVLQERGPLPWPEAFALALQILEGIGHAHALGILHRDLKPANVILTPSGKLKLMDFGIAQALGAARLTRDGRIVGTLEYLAPERIQGKPAGVRSDLYSAGVMLYEMLTGRLPFAGGSEYDLLMAQVQKEPPAPGELGVDLPAAVESAAMRALEKDPDRRYPDAASFAAALLAPLPKPGAGPKPTRLVEMPPPRPRWKLTAALALGAAAAGVTVMLVRPAPKPSRAHAAVDSAAPKVAQTEFPQDLRDVPAQLPPPAPAAPVISFPRAEPSPRKAATPVMPPSAASPAPAITAPPAAPPAVSPEARRGAVAALGTSEDPIRFESLLAALRAGGSAVTADVAGPIAGRGVDFPLTPANEADLRAAGAPPELLKLIAASYTAPKAQPAAKTLAGIRSIFVESAPEAMDRHIKDEIRRQLGGLLRIAESAGEADAVMRIVVEAQKGGSAVAGAARVFGIRDRAVVRATILASGSSRVLWQQGTGDRKPVIGAFRGEAPSAMAQRIVRELKEDLVNPPSQR